MEGLYKKILMSVAQIFVISICVFSQNPVVQTIYTADPAPMVYKDTVFLYVGHDEDASKYFTMKDWHIYSTTDMVNWRDRGVGLSLKDFKWAKKDAWAGQVIERNGKFYWYVPMDQSNGKGMAIGVAVSESPTGPFKDALGKCLVTTGWGDIDPTVFIDTDGQAYLYWGNPALYYIKLNEDMVSYDGKIGIVKVPLDRKGFKPRVVNPDKTFSWADSVLCEESDVFKDPETNIYYWYVAALNKANMKKVIGVAVSDKSVGPFRDLLGKPLIAQHCDSPDINPTIISDKDNQPCLIWGEKQLWKVQLKEDRMSYNKTVGITKVAADRLQVLKDLIAGRSKSNGKRITTYEEGPWFYKRNGVYYLIYAAGGVPEHLAYSTSSHATGPWRYRDTIMAVIRRGGAFTNHPGVIDYRGKSFFFYHNGALPGGGGFDRSVCVEQFDYNSDGTIPRILPTRQGVPESLNLLNPFIRQQAETIAWEKGVETAISDKVGVFVTKVKDGGYIKVRAVNFSKNFKSFEASVASDNNGGRLEIRADSLNGMLLGVMVVSNTGGMSQWKTIATKVKAIKGIHDLYFVFKGKAKPLFNFDWWIFK